MGINPQFDTVSTQPAGLLAGPVSPLGSFDFAASGTDKASLNISLSGVPSNPWSYHRFFKNI